MGKGKIVMVLVVLICIGGLGFYFYQSTQNQEKEKQMKEASEDYFNKYTRTIESSSAYVITLKELKQANENGENYKLDQLEKCDENKTKATVNIDLSDGTISKTEVKLNC